jgi:aldehyde dehydrogenase
MIDEQQLRKIVESVVESVASSGGGGASVAPAVKAPPASAPATPTGARGDDGVFENMEDAVAAAKQAFIEFKRFSIRDRERLIGILRMVLRDHAEDFSRRVFEETGMGDYKDKILKHQNCAKNTPGTEDLVSRSWSGEKGVCLEEYAPYGVIGAITPSTHPTPTMINNMIIMLAGGNTVVFNAHPSAKKISAYGLQACHKAVVAGGFPANLFTCVKNPSIESANTMFNHPDVRLLSITGGPGVVRAAMNTNKKVIAAGPGNPPVLVDETADLDKAARSIMIGGGFDNNILCIAEKEVFVVESVFDRFLEAMTRAGGIQLDNVAVQLLTEKSFQANDKGGHSLNRELVGRSATALADMVKVSVPEGTRMLFGVTERNHLFVQEEQMMPMMPIVKVKDFEDGLDACLEAEHGFGHTALIHSRDMERITRFAQVMNTTIVVANGYSNQGDGPDDGEAYMAFTIASPTGEGITAPRHFCRVRRLAIAENLRFV